MPHRRSLICLLIAATVVIAAAPRSDAATFAVDSTVDAVDAAPADGICATAVGACTLRAAIQTANAAAGADTITLPAGTYTLAILGTNEEQAVTGDLDVTDALTIVGAGVASSIIDGGAIDRVLDVRASSFEVRDASIRSGNAPYSGGALSFQGGGGIRATGSSVVLDHVTVTGCRGPAVGGVAVADGSLDVRSSTISGNDAFEIYGTGGGIAVWPGNGSTASCTITDTAIIGNHAELGGGGLYVYASYPATATLTIARSTISDNVTSLDNAWGGGVLVQAHTNIDETVISGNVAYRAGGLYTYNSDLRIARSTVSGNIAQETGGLALAGGLAENVTVSGNTATGDRGGVSGGVLRNVTVTANVADADDDGDGAGGGVVGSDVANSIVAGNTRGNGTGDDCSGTVTASGYDLIQHAEGCIIGGDLTGVVLALAPALGPLAMNGGPTATHALLAGSPALDAGNPASVGSGPTACPAIDQRSAVRPYASRCDLGAVEQTYPITACGNGVVDAGEQCDDGNVRDGDCCTATCQLAGAGAPCSGDTNVCTTDTCDGAGTCTTANNTGPCTTLSYCVVNETCSGGTCGGGEPRPCDDGVACSADGCHPTYGCFHVANDAACDDADACSIDTCNVAPYPFTGGFCSYLPASGVPCDDDNVCTTDDTCTVGICHGQGRLACPDCLACDPATGCTVDGPEPTCAEPSKTGWSNVQLADSTTDAADAVKWSWKSRATVPSFGTPTASTTYDLCVYEESAGTPSLVLHAVPGTGTCDSSPCWRATSHGFKYKDRAGAADGLTSIVLNATSTTKIALKAKGVNVPPLGLPLAADPAVVVQLRGSNGGCWGASFGTPLRNSASQFKAKSD